MNIRIGKGFDLHRLKKGLPLFLGGISIPFEKGCVAHSDGDVLIHALIDALLGAAGKGDIGTLFPDTDPAYNKAEGKELLNKTIEFLPPFSIINIDLTIFCEQPKIGPYRDTIENSIGSMLNIDTVKINLKAKTMEQIGPIGNSEAIAADAVVLLELQGE